MLNHSHSEQTPGPECVLFADLLPLLGENALPEPEASNTRAHLATCTYCRQEYAAYQRIEANLRRHFGALPALRFSPEDLLRHAGGVIPPAAPAPTVPPAPMDMPRPRRIRRVVSLFSMVAAALVVIAVVTALVASHGGLPKTGRTLNPVVRSPTPTAAPQEAPYVPNPSTDGLSTVQMLSPTEGWAVGSGSSAGQPNTPAVLILHYSNGHWKRMQAPSNQEIGLPDADLYSIAMVSAGEGWAVGNGGFSQPLPSAFMLHYSAGKWTRFSLMRDAELWSVQMVSPTDGWASGGGGWDSGQGATTGILLHYDGTRWTPVQTPDVTGITGLDMNSATDGWATGTDTMLHYNGKQWSIFQHMPGIFGLSMDSAIDGWAIGLINNTTNHTATSNVIWYYHGSQWVQGSLPSAVNYDAQVLAIPMDSATDGWAVGYGTDAQSERYALYLHYTQGRCKDQATTTSAA